MHHRIADMKLHGLGLLSWSAAGPQTDACEYREIVAMKRRFSETVVTGTIRSCDRQTEPRRSLHIAKAMFIGASVKSAGRLHRTAVNKVSTI